MKKHIHIHSYLKCIVYDELLKPRQSFRITLYIYIYIAKFGYPIEVPLKMQDLWDIKIVIK